jgi:hypothetical protein
MVDLIRFDLISKIALPKLMHPTMAIIWSTTWVQKHGGTNMVLDP